MSARISSLDQNPLNGGTPESARPPTSMHPLFELAPAAAATGAIIGAATLLIAGTIGLVVTDLKRVIAYSTMSQIGYMIMAVSSAAYAAGMFHMMTHAFFKALLFMAAGSVISAMGGEQSLNKMGGFKKAMPFTYFCFVIGGLALSGVPATADDPTGKHRYGSVNLRCRENASIACPLIFALLLGVAAAQDGKPD